MAMAWYAVMTQPLQELTAQQELYSQGIQAFFPRYEVSKVVRGCEVTVRRPFMPNYIFPRFDVEEERWRFINGTRGVKRLLPTWTEMPTPIHNDVMQLLLDQCDGEIIDAPEADRGLQKFVPVGSLVRINEGPFEGHAGKVDQAEFDRIRVVLGIFGRQTPIKMSASAVSIL